MEVARGAEDDSLAFGDAFLLIRPLARELERGFDSLSSSVHGQDHVVPEKVSDLLCEAAEHGVVERARGEREPLRLLRERGDEARVAVALVDRPAYPDDDDDAR